MVAASGVGSSHRTGSLYTQGKKQKLFSVTYSHSLRANSTDQASSAEASRAVGHCSRLPFFSVRASMGLWAASAVRGAPDSQPRLAPWLRL